MHLETSLSVTNIVVAGTVLYDFVQIPYTDIFAAKYVKTLDDQVRCAK